MVIDADKLVTRHAARAGGDFLVEASVLEARKAALKDAGRRGLLHQDVASAEAEAIDRQLIALREREETST